MQRAITISLIAFINLSCSMEPTAPSHPDWFTGYGPTRGHEDLVRFSVASANAWIQSQHGQVDFYSPIPSGENGLRSSIPMIQGVTRSDIPDAEMLRRYNVSAADWHTTPDLQGLHFLRNYDEKDGTVSFEDACQDSRQRLVDATLEAWQAMTDGNSARGMYYLGHALHMIQDSFSPAHTQREGNDLKSLTDICAYDRPQSEACVHQELDPRDRVWKATIACQINPDLRTWDCLNRAAQQSVYASTGFLVMFADAWLSRTQQSNTIGSHLFDYLETPRWERLSGYFHCGQTTTILPIQM